MKHLYFIRHGESELNVAKLVGGHLDTPLTPRGKEQAVAAGKAARDAGLVFDVIVSSPLQRAHHTAQEIAKLTGYPIDLIELRDDVKERHFGELDGKDLSHFDISPDEYMANPFAIDHLQDVETINDLHNRAQTLIEHLRQRPEETILVVSHGAFGRSLQRAASGLGLHEPVEPFDNAQLIKLI